MIPNAFRDLRKLLYRLESSNDPVSQAVLQGALAVYRGYDSLILRRASRPDLGAEKVIIPQFRLLFVAVPKVATRSILQALSAAVAERGVSQRVIESDIQTLVNRYPDVRSYLKFTFVRNPWSRAASCYRDKILNTTPIKRARHLHNRYGLEKNMTFRAYAEWLNSSEGSDRVADRHWMSQYRVLELDEGLISYDFIGRFERLSADYQRVNEIFDIGFPPLSHQLKTQRPDGYLSLFDDCTVDLIAQRYRRDIAEFGYEFHATNATDSA